MKMNKAKIICIRLIALLLSLSTLGVMLSSCALRRVEDPVLECKGEAISLSFYEYLLSRMKGTLARNKYDVKSDSFWEKQTADGSTLEEHYNASILDSCRTYLAAMVMFEEEGLKLSDETLASIEEEIAFYIDYDGKGDEDAFNEILAEYGTDVDGLREAYINQAKYEYLVSSLYGADGSLIADTVKEEYYRESYYRFKQVLIPNFYYEYQRDAEGNVIYFDSETGKPLYDKEKGTYVYDAEGNRVKDSYGCTIYYDTDGNIVYDTEKGKPSVELDSKGEGKRYYYSDAEMAERKALSEEIFSSLTDGNVAAFESAMEKYNVVYGEESYPDGYYLSDIEGAGYDEYLIRIFSALKELDEGEIAYVETDYGYHVIMRYELDEGKYADKLYAEWFTGFTNSLVNKLFLDKCEKIIPDIKEVPENLERAKSIKDIGINFDY